VPPCSDDSGCGDVDHDRDRQRRNAQDDRRDGQATARTHLARRGQSEVPEHQTHHGDQIAEDVDEGHEGAQGAQQREDEAGDSQPVRAFGPRRNLNIRNGG
jgi:hypothetical protein